MQNIIAYRHWHNERIAEEKINKKQRACTMENFFRNIYQNFIL